MCSIRVVNERRLLGYRRVARIRLKKEFPPWVVN
jgi:hypothetical protein